MNWRQNPQRVAWVVLLANFFLCCLLAVVVPLGVRSFVLHSTRAVTAAVTALSGTAQVYLPGNNDPTAVTERRPVPEGSRVVTDGTTRALLGIASPRPSSALPGDLRQADTLTPWRVQAPAASAQPALRSAVPNTLTGTSESGTALPTLALGAAPNLLAGRSARSPSSGPAAVLMTVQLSQDTSVLLRQIRAPRFDFSRDPTSVVIELERGRVFVATQTSAQGDVLVKLITPQATISIASGTFDVTSTENETLVRSEAGSAEVTAAGQRVVVSSGERTVVASGQPPEPPVSAALNLVLNGTFEGKITPPWQELIEVASGLPPGEIDVVTDDQRRVVLFSRRAEDGAPNRVGIFQALDRDVEGYDALVLRFDLQLLYQSVPGGGYLATEYPVMVDLSYTDIYGKDLHWYQGFYYMDLPEGSTYLPPTGEKIPRGIWYTYESPNLYELLRETRPARIMNITLYASGHDYESQISNVALIVR